MKKAVLLINLGTPISYKPKDVYRYLIEFLTDKRVIDLPWLKRTLLVRGIIVPFRYRSSAKSYQSIWTEEGSPLLVYGNTLKKNLQEALGEDFKVELAMRYQFPSLSDVLSRLENQNLEELIVLPLFPQYASATTGSICEKLFKSLGSWQSVPKVTVIPHFFNYPLLIQAFATLAKEAHFETYDHIVMSFHGLPEDHLKKSNPQGCCLSNPSCCKKLDGKNALCYAAQCHATAQLIAKELSLKDDQYTLSFQSRLGKNPWIGPYTSQILENLAKKGVKKVLVLCPSFVCDCLETLFEIGIEYAHLFKQYGGEQLDLMPGLNDHPLWTQTLVNLIHANTSVPV